MHIGQSHRRVGIRNRVRQHRGSKFQASVCVQVAFGQQAGHFYRQRCDARSADSCIHAQLKPLPKRVSHTQHIHVHIGTGAELALVHLVQKVGEIHHRHLSFIVVLYAQVAI